MNFSITNVILFSMVLLIALLFCSCSIMRKPYAKDLGKINDKTCDDLKKKYGMDCIGLGLGLEKGNEKVQTLYIRFTMKKVMNLTEARKIAVASLQIFINNIVDNKNFLKLYAVEGFDESNLNMTIIFLNPDGNDVIDPYIGVVSMYNYKLSFRTNDPENPNRYKTEIIETLEEARKKAAEG